METIRKLLARLGFFKKEPPTYNDLPNEIKMDIINMLGSKGRSKMSQVSKLCAAQCKESPFYLQNLEFSSSEIKPKIEVGHAANRTDYILTFGENEIICLSRNEERVLWRENLEKSEENANLNCCRHFEKMLEEHQKSIRSIVINPYSARYLKFDVASFPRLENLQIILKFGIDYYQIFGKLVRPLRTLEVLQGYDERDSDYDILEYDQIYQVLEKISLSHSHLKNEHLIRFTAKYLDIKIGDLTEENIANWLRTYQNGTMQHTIINYTFSVGDSDFDCHKLWRLLGSNEQNLEKLFAIRRNDNRRKFLYLKFTHGCLVLTNPML
ncbi:unnamed protein product [Caenorhabditis angaria]|uniref:F-box domain-containing protein n=1 Tax=Caenorhabditis angaria TaxID=860376 RepID=A0A9P1NCY7_9PELO|nr:unnamed protein product [Caenorhabditis angaria]